MMGTILPRRFEPIRVLRKGSASSTFLATDQQLARNEVVVKVIGKGSLTSDTASLFDIFSWYRGLRHPHVSEILDAGFTPKRDVFCVRNHLPDSQFFHSTNRESARSIVSAIDFLQSVRRVHGAIKPSNVFASAGVLQLADPWIGRSFTNSKQLAEEDIRFSAPEVLSGNAPNLESDLYSLGALLYRFFSGRDPFEDSDPEFLKEKYLWASPRSLSSVCHVSRSMAGIVAQLLDKDPVRRRPALESLKNELEIEAVLASRAPAVGLTPKVDQVLEFVASHRGFRVVIVEGPAGSGKSRLMEELASRVSLGDRSVVICETKGPEPYLTLTRNLICLADQYDISAGPSCLKRLQQFVDQAQEPTSKSDVGSINHDLETIFAAIARQLRLVVVIEDIDRTGRRLTSLLQDLGRQVEDADLSVVVTTRPASSQGKGTGSLRECLTQDPAEIVMGLLTDAESALLTSFLSKDADHRDHAKRSSGGHPAFLEEFCQYPSGTVVPKPVRQVLSGLIADLPTPIRHVAEVLSIFQEPTTLDVITTVSGLEKQALELAINKLVSTGLVDPERLTIRYPAACALLDAKMSKARRTELHARAFQCLQALNCKESILADHAFNGGLMDIACQLYRELASQSFTERDFRSSERYFDLASRCSQNNCGLPPLDFAEHIKLAKCCGFQGNKGRAKGILTSLLATKQVAEDPDKASAVYSTLALPKIENSPQERVRLVEAAIRLARPDSPKMIHLYGSLATAQLSLGNLVKAQEALDKVASFDFCQTDLQQLDAIRGSVLMNQGRFKEAVRCFSGKPCSWASPEALSINLSVCLEQLGEVRKAREIQESVLRAVELRGAHFDEVVSLMNLGAMECKLGNIGAAEAHFARAQAKARTLHKKYGDGAAGYSLSLFLDRAALAIQKGEYRDATICLDAIDRQDAGPFFPLELFLVALTRCELHLDLGQHSKVLALLEQTKSLPLTGEFFDFERLLIRERVERASGELCERLSEALGISETLGTAYQACRIRIALAKQQMAINLRDQANTTASVARRIATKNGYKVLAAKALLFVAVSESRVAEQESLLQQTMDEADELRFAPLVAEVAFQLGRSRFLRGDYHGAQECLSKSISITSRLADELTVGAKRNYLSRTEHRAARALFNEAFSKELVSGSRMRPMFAEETDLFAKTYRLATTMAGGSDFDSAIRALVQTLKEAMVHSIVVVAGNVPKVTYYAARGTVTEEMRKRILSIATSASDRPYLAGNGIGRDGTTFWIPILSTSLKSGIYVESAPDGLLIDERDIEFLTVTAKVAAAAFDQIGTRVVLLPLSSGNHYGIVGTSRQIQDVCNYIHIAATNSASLLLEGESGTGKELVARAIHQQSSRGKGPFIAVDCGALPEGLIEAELFGAKKGAYTGAASDRIGLFEAANHGTLFLDEISNLGLISQAKLLRVLQEREVRSVGSITGRAIDVRLIAATNCNLEKLVRDGRFRQDLLYRLKVLHILLPPLRDRREDIPALSTTFLERLNAANQSKKYFGPRVMDKLTRHNFPGNIRELQNAVERAFYMAPGSVISDVELFREPNSIDGPRKSETETWFRNLTEGREDFWSAVHDRYKRRDISREKVISLIDYGLRAAEGCYKTMASMLQIPKEDYHRFMDFLRRSQCLLDFRPYRKFKEDQD